MPDEKPEAAWIKLMAGVLKESGLPSFMFFVGFILFLWTGTTEQKTEFIDRFILWKTVDNEIFPATFVLALILITCGGTIFFQKIKIKSMKDEIKRMAEEKDKLQEVLLGKRLESSE